MRILTPALITLIMLIVVGALIVVYIGKSFFYRPAPPPQEVATRLVPMASADIPAGTLITSSHLVNGRLRTDKLVRETILNSNAIVGRYALTDIKQAQPILTSNLYAPNTRPPLELNPGMQAVTIPMGDSTTVVDGLFKPGDYVDVRLTVDDNPADPRYRGGFTMTMFKGVRVLAINRLTQQSDVGRGPNTVTFELTPAQANILLEARQHGTLTVTYNPDGPGTGGVEIADADRAHFEEILGLPEIPEPPAPFLMELYRGPHRALINYDDEYEWDNRNRATPWTEQPGWVPPRGGAGWGGWGGGRGLNNYRGGYGRGYRGTQTDPGQMPSGDPSVPQMPGGPRGPGQMPAAMPAGMPQQQHQRPTHL